MNSRVCLIRYPPKSNGYHLFPIAILGISHWQTHAMVILVLPGIIVARVIFQNLPFTAEAKKTRFEKTLHLSSPPKKSFHCDKSWTTLAFLALQQPNHHLHWVGRGRGLWYLFSMFNWATFWTCYTDILVPPVMFLGLWTPLTILKLYHKYHKP